MALTRPFSFHFQKAFVQGRAASQDIKIISFSAEFSRWMITPPSGLGDISVTLNLLKLRFFKLHLFKVYSCSSALMQLEMWCTLNYK